jgi:hypothetical protein
MKLDQLKALAHGAGRSATHGMRTQLFGTRDTPKRNASDAHSQVPAVGVFGHSVWDGPRVRRNGGPVVRRDRSA